MITRIITLGLVVTGCFVPLTAEELVTLRGNQVELIWATAGGALVSFRRLDEPTNPLNFEVTPELERREDNAPILRGHFICLDRWGAPSKSEEARGIPFHGEAPRIVWRVEQAPVQTSGKITAKMSCLLPLAKLKVEREITLDGESSVALVTEKIKNTNHLSRIYNLVQHPSIAPPFLNDGTLVDSNADVGFAQDLPIPATPATASRWPMVSRGQGEADLRRFRDDAGNKSEHDVSSFVFRDHEKFGWVTASSPKHKLLLGYVWRTDDYGWLNIWRYRREGKLAARGLEFGTTGYHQPFPILVRQSKILDRHTYEPLDADETIAKSYLCFLARIPDVFQGVANLRLEGGAIRLKERRETNPTEIEIRTTLSLLEN